MEKTLKGMSGQKQKSNNRKKLIDQTNQVLYMQWQ